MNNQQEQSPEQLEEEIERTRQQLSGTAERLQQKFSPNELVDQALDYLRTNKELRRNVATTVRQNPIPLCLMGIGLIWLIATGASGPRRRAGSGEGFDAAPQAGDPRFSDHPEGPSPQTYPSGSQASSNDDSKVKQKMNEAKAKASHAAESVKERF